MAGKQEKEEPRVCVCGRRPAIVKCKSGWLAACPNAMACAIRGNWGTNEQQAIKSWNTAVQAARHDRGVNK